MSHSWVIGITKKTTKDVNLQHNLGDNRFIASSVSSIIAKFYDLITDISFSFLLACYYVVRLIFSNFQF